MNTINVLHLLLKASGKRMIKRLQKKHHLGSKFPDVPAPNAAGSIKIHEGPGYKNFSNKWSELTNGHLFILGKLQEFHRVPRLEGMKGMCSRICSKPTGILFLWLVVWSIIHKLRDHAVWIVRPVRKAEIRRKKQVFNCSHEDAWSRS